MQTVLSHTAILQTQKRSEAEIPTQLSEFISLGWSEGSYYALRTGSTRAAVFWLP